MCGNRTNLDKIESILFQNTEDVMPDQLQLRSASLGTWVLQGVYDNIHLFSFDFDFGKSYLLDSEICKGSWALSWLISGDKYSWNKRTDWGPFGDVLFNGKPYTASQRYVDAWRVMYGNQYKSYWFRPRTVIEHIRYGLQNNPNPYLKSEQDYISRFMLTPERLNRPITHLSGERWSASCAIGLAYGKRMFCFPYVEFVRPYFIEDRFDWLKSIIDTLCEAGTLVVFPALATDISRLLCDIVVPIRRIPDELIPRIT
jgi:hypothetical protein